MQHQSRMMKNVTTTGTVRLAKDAPKIRWRMRAFFVLCCTITMIVACGSMFLSLLIDTSSITFSSVGSMGSRIGTLSSSDLALIATTTTNTQTSLSLLAAMTSSFPAFDDLPGLHPILKQNLQTMQLKTMTEIQAKTWEAASQGQDVLGRARTGTGKVRVIVYKQSMFLRCGLVHMCCVFFIFDCLIWNEQAGKTLNDSLFYFNVNCLFMCLFA